MIYEPTDFAEDEMEEDLTMKAWLRIPAYARPLLPAHFGPDHFRVWGDGDVPYELRQGWRLELV